jgi:hypothetical protein
MDPKEEKPLFVPSGKGDEKGMARMGGMTTPY